VDDAGEAGGSPPTRMTDNAMFSPETEEAFRKLAARYPVKRSALVPMLALAQQEHGWVRPEAIEYVATYLELSPSDVESVVSFYTLLHRRSVGQNVLLVCTNISCMLCGSDAIQATLREKLGIDWGETTPDGRFTLIEAECLGSCTTAPVLQVNGVFHENLTAGKVERLLDELGDS
jgi:NADH-quinone oxidoreductase subunit E